MNTKNNLIMSNTPSRGFFGKKKEPEEGKTTTKEPT
jgi:hypothetical protein